MQAYDKKLGQLQLCSNGSLEKCKHAMRELEYFELFTCEFLARSTESMPMLSLSPNQKFVQVNPFEEICFFVLLTL